MKTTMMVETEVNITHVRISADVRYGDEQMPYDFPGRHGDIWEATVNIDTAQIEGWPKADAKRVHLKVVDGGTYTLLDSGKVVATLENDYVPHGVVPGEYGDYLILDINAHGVITNWPKCPDVSKFFRRCE